MYYVYTGIAMTKTARLFNNGSSQAVRLPAEFRFDGDEVLVRRDEPTGEVILSQKAGWSTWKEYFELRDRAAGAVLDPASPVRESLISYIDTPDWRVPRVPQLLAGPHRNHSVGRKDAVE